jgi:dipeptidyl-peptidase-4
MLEFKKAALAIAVLVFCISVMDGTAVGSAQGEGGDTPAARLTIDRLYGADEFTAESAPDLAWIEDGKRYVVLEQDDELSLAAFDSLTGEKKVLAGPDDLTPEGSTEPLDIESYDLDIENNKVVLFTDAERVWRRNTRGDYWILDLGSKALRQLGKDCDPSSLMFAKLSPDGTRAAYVYKNNILVEDLATGAVKQLTHDGSDTVINGTFDWVYEEELGLRDGFRWSSDSRRIAFWRLDSSAISEFSLINTTDSLYPEVTRFRYPKVGEPNSIVRIGVAEIDSGKTTWLELPGEPKSVYLARMDWAADATGLLVQQLDRRQQTNRVFLCDATNVSCTQILEETDAAWVELHASPRWINGGTHFLWLSERDGYRHLYRVSRDGTEVTLLTPDSFDVIALEAIDENRKRAYFTASPNSAAQRHLFEVALDKPGRARRVTPLKRDGTHSYDIAPDAGVAVHTYSALDYPPVVNLISLPNHETVRTLVTNAELRQKVAALELPSMEFFTVPIGGGTELDGWLFKPPGFDAELAYPVLVYVYGEPAGQTVLDRWGGTSQLWHMMVAQQGYVVLSIDNRGTPAPRGRDWRKVVYGQIGILASEEQSAAMNALKDRWPWIDGDRLAIWGWSGGGSMTLNMMFRFPGLYAAGMSVAPVADQRLYDTIYQERYMGLLEDNEEGYVQGSPITFAHQLEGKLLVVHGSGDDNVHCQNTDRLVNELIVNDKQFSMMVYPNRSHSIREGKNTSRHLRQLLTSFLLDNVPAGPRTRNHSD